MSDRYLSWANSSWGKPLCRALGLPQPALLNRRAASQNLPSSCLLGTSEGGDLHTVLTECLAAFPSSVAIDNVTTDKLEHPEPQKDARYGALVLDASGIKTVDGLQRLHQFFHQHIRQLQSCGRVLLIGRPPERCESTEQQIAQRSLEGFIRSLCRELRRGSTGHLIYVASGAEQHLASTVRFCCSTRATYISGQVIRLQAGGPNVEPIEDKPLSGKTALVTGASRGIGEAISRTLAAEGAKVIGLDVPAAAMALEKLTKELNGDSIALDITGDTAPTQLCEWLQKNHGGIDIVVHNAGVTRDKSLANMPLSHWQLALDVNLAAPHRITEALLQSDTLHAAGRIIGVSSISGIAGNLGQTNYSASKAGVIGLVDAYSQQLSDKQITVNAVAPGFIETEMTAKVPFVLRQLGRRMNSLKQGGQPVDVAEAIAWFAEPASGAVNGNTIRVCGQSLLGA